MNILFELLIGPLLGCRYIKKRQIWGMLYNMKNYVLKYLEKEHIMTTKGIRILKSLTKIIIYCQPKCNFL